MLLRVYCGFGTVFFIVVAGKFFCYLITTRSGKIILSAEIISRPFSVFSKLGTDAGVVSVENKG